MLPKLVFSLLFTTCLFCKLEAIEEDEEVVEKPAPKTWVLLVAGSNGWYNYRHQADVCHAYQIVRSHGIPEENIIVMMYDDIAHSDENPTPGIVLNHPHGQNVYKGVKKDYVGKDVTPENFLNVLTGNQKAMKKKGSGKVVDSTSIDHIFVNFVDHGAPGILAFPSGELTVGELQKALKSMYFKKRFAKMVMYIEACESGSMFRNILPSNYNIFVTTAANFNESSYACYFDELRETYLGDLYSVNWMENTDTRDIEQETLQAQYLIVQKETNLSHVEEYGDMSISRMFVGEFQGEEKTEKIFYPSAKKSAVRSEDVPFILMQKKARKSNDLKIQKQFIRLKDKRRYVEKIMRAIANDLAENISQADDWLKTKPDRISDFDCHTSLVHIFSEICFNFGEVKIYGIYAAEDTSA